MDEEINATKSMRSLQITLRDEEDEIDDSGEVNSYDDDDDDVEEEDEEKEPVGLGVLEKPENSWSLRRELFPSKAGGTPAWLDPVNLPTGRSCLCDFCAEPLQFMLQVYAPLTEKDSTFHRTLFLFMCTSMACLLKDQHEQWKRNQVKPSRSVKVFCCQLPRNNSFYSSEPPRNNGKDKPSRAGAVLCGWCGTWKGDKVCGGCRRAHYCSEKHQAVHWKSGHKRRCLPLEASESSNNWTVGEMQEVHGDFNPQSVASNSLWPEYEIAITDECEDKISDDNGELNSLISSSRVDESIESLIDSFEGEDDKKSWASFQERISRTPEQVLRYYRDAGAKPLWPMSSGQPSKAEIPKCSYCGGRRVFEFQVLPQVLYYFGVENDVNSLDWATIAVYTCEASCDGSMAYKEEFVWVQIASQSSTTHR
ncbi:uncharacterized protein [Nicotiana sylvestris]|uniref:Programmed cell death protein 2 isoform X1 n=1 Tax=Nicotiana sylvestris TaxID=4096 RepID=A0A1U7VWB1_NICSY|nr:PREDICTED: programmed cell death protein 2 isoform X1 [Nicotiana sylvestris]